MICPAIIPVEPAAFDNSAINFNFVSVFSIFESSAIKANASVSNESPARIAVASSKALWLVGLPRR